MDPNLYYSTRNSYRSNEDSIQHGDTMENNIMIVEGEDEMMGEVMRRDDSDNAIYDAWIAATASMTTTCITPTITVDSSSPRVTNKILQDQVGRNNRGRRLGSDAWNKLQRCMTAMDPDGESRTDNIENATGPLFRSERPPHEHGNENTIYTIENTIASLSHLNVSPDGTTKLLLKMKLDGLEVESVIIPWTEKGFSTLCVS